MCGEQAGRVIDTSRACAGKRDGVCRRTLASPAHVKAEGHALTGQRRIGPCPAGLNQSFLQFRLRLFSTTLTELHAMAALPIMGFNKMP